MVGIDSTPEPAAGFVNGDFMSLLLEQKRGIEACDASSNDSNIHDESSMEAERYVDDSRLKALYNTCNCFSVRTKLSLLLFVFHLVQILQLLIPHEISRPKALLCGSDGS